MFNAVKRGTLLYPSGVTDHLFIILCDPKTKAEQVLMVPVCTIRGERYDETCILKVGDHEFIKEPSYISYAHARTEPAQKLVHGVQSGEFTDRGLMPEGVFAVIVGGIFKSPFAKPYARTFLKEK